MVFDSSSNKTDKSSLATNNELLQSENAIKYLGIFIDYKLSLEHNINHVVKQISIAKGILSILRYHAPLLVLKEVNFNIAYSHLHYGIIAWVGTGSAVALQLRAPPLPK